MRNSGNQENVITTFNLYAAQLFKQTGRVSEWKCDKTCLTYNVPSLKSIRNVKYVDNNIYKIPQK